MKRTMFLSTLALCIASTSSLAAQVTSPASTTPEFGKDLIVDVSGGLGAAAKSAGIPGDVWRWNGVARIDAEGIFDVGMGDGKIAAEPSDTSVSLERRKGSQRWIAVNLDTGFEYRVDMSRQFAHEIHRFAELSGTNMGDPRVVDKRPGISTELTHDKGWSLGQDGRTRRFDNTSYPFSAIGQMGGSEVSGCTGTLVARNVVLTAAHCIYNRKNDSFYSKTSTRFRPGREGECTTAACQPYGEHNATWYFTPAEFRDATDNPWPYDYGIMVTSTYPGDQASWMGYVAMGDSDLKDFCSDRDFGGDGRCFTRGYPACDLGGAPQGTGLNACVQGWPYQDVDNCEIGTFGSKVNGWNTRFTVNCDLSPGHSGSAVFTDIWASNKKVVFGVVSTQSCSTCTDTNNPFPNAIRRITPDVIDAISYFKAAYP